MAEKPNGVVVEEEEQSFSQTENEKKKKNTTENVYDVVQRLISEPSYTATLIKTSLSPFIPESSRDYTRRILLWSRQGSSLRPLLLISVPLLSLSTLSLNSFICSVKFNFTSVVKIASESLY
jgi:hypothetical protein